MKSWPSLCGGYGAMYDRVQRWPVSVSKLVSLRHHQSKYGTTCVNWTANRQGSLVCLTTADDKIIPFVFITCLLKCSECDSIEPGGITFYWIGRALWHATDMTCRGRLRIPHIRPVPYQHVPVITSIQRANSEGCYFIKFAVAVFSTWTKFGPNRI